MPSESLRGIMRETTDTHGPTQIGDTGPPTLTRATALMISCGNLCQSVVTNPC